MEEQSKGEAEERIFAFCSPIALYGKPMLLSRGVFKRLAPEAWTQSLGKSEISRKMVKTNQNAVNTSTFGKSKPSKTGKLESSKIADVLGSLRMR